MIGDRNKENRLAIERYGEACIIGHIPILPKIDRSTLLNVYKKHFDHRVFA
jgi:hypothetical protein